MESWSDFTILFPVEKRLGCLLNMLFLFSFPVDETLIYESLTSAFGNDGVESG